MANLKNTTSNINEMPVRKLKKNKIIIYKPNTSIASAIFSLYHKRAKITLFYKRGEKNSVKLPPNCFIAYID